MASVADPPDSNNAPCDETPDYPARAKLALSILSCSFIANSDVAEVAVYEARMALDGRTQQEITDWHSLVVR